MAPTSLNFAMNNSKRGSSFIFSKNKVSQRKNINKDGKKNEKKKKEKMHLTCVPMVQEKITKKNNPIFIPLFSVQRLLMTAFSTGKLGFQGSL